MLQHPTPEDFVIATGVMYSVRYFCTLAFKEAGIELEWKGVGATEKGYNKTTQEVIVEIDPKYYRPAEVEQLLGNPSKAKELLNWNPNKTDLHELVKIMMRNDLKLVERTNS
jgi:GDPmannose 4,6-dehydratase